MTSMEQQLQILNSELMAARQEDEGATCRIEELERYETMSNEIAIHLEMRYGQLRSEFDEQMKQANAIMVHAGQGVSAQMNQLRLELESAETTAKQEALAVGFANDRSCALHVEMIEVENQHQPFRHTMALHMRRLKTELETSDMKRDAILREFRGNVRSDHNLYLECDHHLALEESQLRLQVARDESIEVPH